MAEILADDMSNDDRRRVVSAGIRRGRDAQIAKIRALANIVFHKGNVGPSSRPVESASSSARVPSRIATKGSEDSCRLLKIIEIDADERITTLVSSTSRTSTPPSPNSTPAISPAKRPPTRGTWSAI